MVAHKKPIDALFISMVGFLSDGQFALNLVSYQTTTYFLPYAAGRPVRMCPIVSVSAANYRKAIPKLDSSRADETSQPYTASFSPLRRSCIGQRSGTTTGDFAFGQSSIRGRRGPNIAFLLRWHHIRPL